MSARKARRRQKARTDQFDALLRRLLVDINILQLARRSFGDLSGLSEQHTPAGMLVGETAVSLDALYNELDEWHVTHEHKRKGGAP